MKSESIKEIAKALSNFQSEVKPVKKTKDGVHNSKYAEFDSIIAEATKHMPKYDLSISQLPFNDGDKIGVETILLHSSNEWISSKISLPLGRGNVAHECGIIISYLKRYSYGSILGIATEKDDDGNGLNKQQQQQAVTNKSIKNKIFKILHEILKMDRLDAIDYISVEGEKLDLDYNALLSRVTDLQITHRWDITSKQFLKK